MNDGEIDFMSFEEDPTAPAIFINGVGRICKIGGGTVQVTLIRTLQHVDGPLCRAVCHQIWDEQAFLSHEKLIRYAATLLRGPRFRDAKRLRIVN